VVTDRGIELLRNNPERVHSLLLKSLRGHLGDTGAEERELISERTKASLASAKAQCRKLGNPERDRSLRTCGNSTTVEVVRQAANERAERIRRIVTDCGRLA
jgi:DNA invertase Pin-like site-specific DNA recombinase